VFGCVYCVAAVVVVAMMSMCAVCQLSWCRWCLVCALLVLLSSCMVVCMWSPVFVIRSLLSLLMRVLGCCIRVDCAASVTFGGMYDDCCCPSVLGVVLSMTVL